MTPPRTDPQAFESAPMIQPSATPVAAPAAQVPQHNALEIRELLRIVSERWKIIALAAVIGLLLGIVATLVTTPRYRASALLQYDPAATDSIEQANGKVRQAVANQEMMATQLGLFHSEALARRVAEQLRLADDPAYGGTRGSREERLKRAAKLIAGGIESDSLRNSLLLRVTYSGTDPRMAQRIASAFAQNFIALNLERKYNSSAYARRFLSDQLARTKTALEESEKAVNDYAVGSGLFRTPSQVVDGKTTDGAPLSVGNLAAMEAALNQAQVKRIEAENAWRSGAAGPLPAEGSLAVLEQQRATLRAEYAENLRIFKADYPRMQELAARIARLDSEIASVQGAQQGRQSTQLAAAYKAAARSEADLAARVAAAKQVVQSDRGRSIRYNILQREVDTNRALYDALLQRYKEVGVAGGIGQSTIALIDDAQVPGAPYRPNGIVNAIIGLAFGLGIGLAAAFAAHVLFDTLTDPADVRAKLHLPVLGAIPFESENGGIANALSDPKSPVSEAYYAMLTAIKFARPGGSPHTLFVTSSRPGEGKSTSAYGIAVSSARLGRRVLLIDADLRRPTFLTGDRTAGFGHLLSSEDSVAGFVRPSAIPNLSVLPVGPFSGSAAELLSSARLRAVVEEAAALADLVVLDGPPLLGFTDAPLLASITDATLIVIESGKARSGETADLVRRLGEAGGDLLGAVMTKLRRRGRAGYGYGYYRGHEYDYREIKDDVSGFRLEADRLLRPDQ